MKLNRKWMFSGLFVAWALWISGIFGNSGILQAYKLSQVRRDLTLRVQALENEKEKLQFRLQTLEADPNTQERVIRETLGFVRENEIVFDFL